MSTDLKEKLPAARAAVTEAIAAGVALPVLDLGPFLAGAPEAIEQLAADVRAIQESLGFYAIINHGVDFGLIDDAVEQTRQVFALGPDVLRTYQKQGPHMQGFWPPNSTAVYRPGFDNEKEKYSAHAGWTFLRDHEESDHEAESAPRHRVPNKWPDPALAPGFRPTMNRYHATMLALGLKLVPVYALALGLPADHFDRDFAHPEWYSRCNHYAVQKNAEGELANAAHSDHSFLTLLPMSPVPGLQVRTPFNTWIDVEYIRGGIIVNTGEWLTQVSNGRFLATPHRVLQPSVERITIPMFIDPNDEALNTPVPGALKPGEAPRFAPSTWHEHFVSYMAGLARPSTPAT